MLQNLPHSFVHIQLEMMQKVLSDPKLLQIAFLGLSLSNNDLKTRLELLNSKAKISEAAVTQILALSEGLSEFPGQRMSSPCQSEETFCQFLLLLTQSSLSDSSAKSLEAGQYLNKHLTALKKILTLFLESFGGLKDFGFVSIWQICCLFDTIQRAFATLEDMERLKETLSHSWTHFLGLNLENSMSNLIPGKEDLFQLQAKFHIGIFALEETPYQSVGKSSKLQAFVKQSAKVDPVKSQHLEELQERMTIKVWRVEGHQNPCLPGPLRTLLSLWMDSLLTERNLFRMHCDVDRLTEIGPLYDEELCYLLSKARNETLTWVKLQVHDCLARKMLRFWTKEDGSDFGNSEFFRVVFSAVNEEGFTLDNLNETIAILKHCKTLAAIEISSVRPLYDFPKLVSNLLRRLSMHLDEDLPTETNLTMIEMVIKLWPAINLFLHEEESDLLRQEFHRLFSSPPRGQLESEVYSATLRILLGLVLFSLSCHFDVGHSAKQHVQVGCFIIAKNLKDLPVFLFKSILGALLGFSGLFCDWSDRSELQLWRSQKKKPLST